MKASLVYDKIRWEEKSILRAAEDRGMSLNMINVKSMDMDFDQKIPESFGDITLQRCTSYYRGLHSTAYLEYKGQKVINNLNTLLIAGNKMFTSLSFVRDGIPTPRTSASTVPDVAMKQFTDKFDSKAVLKPVSGSWGRMIALMNDQPAAMAVLEDRQYMYPLYSIYYMQEYVNRPPRDIRIFVIGGRVIGGMYRYQSGNDWRTNAAIGGKGEKCEITDELENLASKASKSVGGGILGVDIMESNDGYLVHEVNSTTEFRTTAGASGVDIPGEIVNYLMEESS